MTVWCHQAASLCLYQWWSCSGCRGPNASNPARGRTLPGQERPSNGRPDASQMRPGSMLCPVGLPGALSVDILALLLYWTTYAPITVRLTSDTHVAYWQWRPEQISVKLEGQIGINMTFSVKKKCFCMRDIIIIFWGATAMHYLMHRFGISFISVKKNTNSNTDRGRRSPHPAVM